MADAELAVRVAKQRELADHQVHHLQVIHRAWVLGRQVPVRGPAHALGHRDESAHDDLTAVDALPPGLELGRAAGHEHRELGRQFLQPVVQRRHRASLRGVLHRPGGQVLRAARRRRLGECRGEYLLHDRHGGRKFERLRAGVLPGDNGLAVPVRTHELAGRREVVRQVGNVAIKVDAEEVEAVLALAGDMSRRTGAAGCRARC